MPAVETPPVWIQVRTGRPGVVDLFSLLGVGTSYPQFDDWRNTADRRPAWSAVVYSRRGRWYGWFHGRRR